MPTPSLSQCPQAPGWIAYIIGTPVLTFVGTFSALALARLRDRELESRSKREETLRTMRWAAVLSADDRPRLAALGVAELEALLDSDLLEESEKTFVEAALGAVYEVPEEALDHLGEEAEAVLGDERTATDRGTSEIPSITDHPGDGGDRDG